MAPYKEVKLESWATWSFPELSPPEGPWAASTFTDDPVLPQVTRVLPLQEDEKEAVPCCPLIRHAAGVRIFQTSCAPHGVRLGLVLLCVDWNLGHASYWTSYTSFLLELERTVRVAMFPLTQVCVCVKQKLRPTVGKPLTWFHWENVYRRPLCVGGTAPVPFLFSFAINHRGILPCQPTLVCYGDISK